MATRAGKRAQSEKLREEILELFKRQDAELDTAMETIAIVARDLGVMTFGMPEAGMHFYKGIFEVCVEAVAEFGLRPTVVPESPEQAEDRAFIGLRPFTNKSVKANAAKARK